MWERMQQSEGGSGGMDFLSTHPANERRIKAIRKWLPEVSHDALYDNMPCADHTLITLLLTVG
jgi:predicted Zn-dependent protease